MSRIRFTEQTAPATPPLNTVEVYPDTADGVLKVKKDDGTVVSLEGAGGGVSDGDKGDITVTGSGATWTIDPDVVTYAKMQDVSATDRVLGRSTAGAGNVEEIPCTAQARALLDDATAADQRATIGAAATSHTHPIADLTDDGALAALNTVGTAQIDNDAVTYAKIQNVSVTDRVLGRSTAGAGDLEEIVCTAAGRALIDDADAPAQRTTLGLGALATLATVGTSQIDNDAVTYAKVQNVSATDRVLGRSTAGAGDVEEIVCTGAGRALIDDADASAQRTTLGLGALATLATVGTTQIDDASVTYAKIQDTSAASRLLGRGSAAGAGDVQEITVGAGLTLTGTDLTASASAPALNDLTDVTLTTPATGAVLVKSAGDWVDGQVDLADADAVTGELGTANIANAAVTYAKIQDVSAATRLLGRGSAAGAGDVEEITIGAGLTLTGTSLTASASAPALDDLTDVTITTPATGATLIFNGTVWIDGQLDLADADAVTGVLPAGNLPTTVVLENQANTYTTGAQDFSAATSLTVPVAAGAAPTVSGQVAYDSTANQLEYGGNGVNRVVVNLDEAQTLTNKTLTSPTLTTPVLGTPSSGTLTSCTGLPIDAGTTGTLGISRGGTGQTAQDEAFDALSPTTTRGDFIVMGAAGDNVRLAVGTSSQVLVGGTDPVWGAVPDAALSANVVMENAANTWSTGAQDMGGATSFEVPNGAGGTTLDATGEICVDSTQGTRGAGTLNFYDGTAERVLTPMHSKSISIEDPVNGEDITLFFTNTAITIREMRAVLIGSATPSVTWTIRHSTTTDRSATGTEVVTSGTTTTSTTTGSDVTAFNDATIEADEFVWLETTAKSGTVDELHVTIFYTEDP